MNATLMESAAQKVRAPTYSVALLLMGLLMLMGLNACNLGTSSNTASALASPTAAPSSPAVPMFEIVSISVSVVVPSGVALTPDKLKVVTSAGQATPTAGGPATVGVFTGGMQLAIANTPAGSPMMMAWIDANHAAIPQADGIGALESAIKTELSINADAFVEHNSGIKQALASFVAPYYANTVPAFLKWIRAGCRGI